MPEEYRIQAHFSCTSAGFMGIESEGNFQIIKATVPQKELYRYNTVLRSLTGGRGLHEEKFSHYEEMPKETGGEDRRPVQQTTRRRPESRSERLFKKSENAPQAAI
jgi:elongation factor G